MIFSNTLAGTDGEQPTDEQLSQSGDSMSVLSPSRSVYSSNQQIHEHNTIQLSTGKHREETPRFKVTGFNDRPFSVRWYCWLSSIGSGNGERRWLAQFREIGLIAHETAYGNLYLQMSPLDISANEISPEASQVAQPIGQWLRIEVQYTTAYAPTVRVYSGHETDQFRQFDFADAHINGGEFHLTGYRYRRRTLVQWGSSGSAVRNFQNELIDINYLPSGSADGAFGDETFFAVQDFQSDHGLLVDGAAGNETRAAIDIVRGSSYAPLYISHLAMSDGAWIGPTSAPIPPLPDPVSHPMTVGLSV